MTKEEVKKRRENLGLTQSQLATEMGVSGNSVSRWELGDSEPESPAMLDKALKWMELSKSLRDDPWFDTAEARLAQMQAKLQAQREYVRSELSEAIGRIEGDPQRAAEVAAMKVDLAEISQ